MNKERPLVSIIMNCYNSDRFLKDAIDSIYIQTYQNWEIIFWDNGSTDKSASIAHQYDERLKYYYVEHTTPLGEARNSALGKVNGKYVSFLDCDDIYLPNKIKLQLDHMESTGAVLSYGSWIKINENGEELNKYVINKSYGNKFIEFIKGYSVNFQTLMIKNSFLKKNQICFDENLSFSPDFNIVLRIAYDSPVLSIDDLLVKYRVHENSMSHKKKIEKIRDFDYTIDFFRAIGVEEKFKNYNYIVLSARYRLLIFDSIREGNYFAIIGLIVKYLYRMTAVLFKRSKYV